MKLSRFNRSKQILSKAIIRGANHTLTNLLTTIQSGRQSRPPRVLLYGVEGIGKSSFGSQAPKPIFIQTEDGLDEINCDRFPLAIKFDDVTSALRTLQSESHDYETVVIDSLDWLERLVWDKLCEQYAVASIEKVDGGYARGYMLALSLWREVLDLLNALRNRGMVVILIDDAGVERAFGECHRYPPTPVQGSVSSGLRFAKFPRVADDTWCGDFQSRRGISRTELAHTRIEEANAASDSVVHEDATDANCGANVAMCQSGSEGVTDRNI